MVPFNVNKLRVSRIEHFVAVGAGVVAREMGVFNMSHHVASVRTLFHALETVKQVVIHFLDAGIDIVQVS